MTFDELNAELARLQGSARARERLRRQLQQVERELELQSERRRRLAQRMASERADVEALEGLSLTALFHTILRSKEDQLQTERREWLAAKLNHDECADGLKALRADRQQLRDALAQLAHVPGRIAELVERKAEHVRSDGGARAEALFELERALAFARARVIEIDEARGAAREARRDLERMLAALDSASSWGTWDLVGGGLIATSIKHGKLDDARAAAAGAQHALRKLTRELQDVSWEREITIDVGGFATFADYFFDGLISDWIVQSRINTSRQRAGDVKRDVEMVLSELDREATTASDEAARLTSERRRFLDV